MLGFEEALLECDKYVTQTMHMHCLSLTCKLAEIFNRYNITKYAVRLQLTNNIEKLTDRHQICNFCRKTSIVMNNATDCDMQVYADMFVQSFEIYTIGGHHWNPLQHCFSIEEKNFNFSEHEPTDEDRDHMPKVEDRDLVNPDLQYKQLSSLPAARLEEYRVTGAGTDVYVTGGFDDRTLKASNRVRKYDTATNNWTEVSQMRYKR